MKPRSWELAQAAMIAALYVILTHAQNLLLPGSASWAIQLRLSEALCIFSFFTPAAATGLAVGCFLFNLTFSPALPLDFLVGPAATWLAAKAMYRLRRQSVPGFPLAGLLMPALFNGLLVGWELTVYVGGAFPLNALYVAAGEAAVLLTLGLLLYLAVKKRNLHTQLLFSRQ